MHPRRAQLIARLKANPNYGARAGQTIVGNLARGSDGKFASGGTGGPTARQQRAEQRRTARQTRQDDRARARDEGQRGEDATRSQEDAYVAAGATSRERAARRREITAKRRERAAAAREARRQQSAEERMARSQEDAAERAQRTADAERAAAEKPKGGGGGGKAKPSDEDKARAAAEKRTRAAVQTAQAVGLDSTFVDGLRGAAEGRLTGPAPRLEALGFAENGEATDQGRRALAALERGDTRGYLAAVQDAKGRMGRETAAQARRTAAEQRRSETQAKRSASLTRLQSQARAGQKLTQTQRNQLTDAGMAEEGGGTWRVKGFTVYKDAAGRDRWVSISSTAYRDRDGEIVSRAALKAAVAQGDATGNRGPLRFWHVPGVDIGDCDYQAVAHDGRLLVESGTFRRPAYAQALKARGAGYQVSIGFVHPVSQPGPGGVFTDIAIFERSITPPGRASNPFTSITTKEGRMLPPDKDEQLAALLGGRESAAYKAATATITTTDKAAQDTGIAFKSDDAPAVYDFGGQPAIIQDGRVIVLKALALAPVAEAETEKALPPIEEAKADPMLEVVEEVAAEPIAEPEAFLTEAELDMLADRVAQKLAPLFEIEKKMSASMAELKGMFGGVQATKDAAVAQVSADVAALAADVARLKGDAPLASQAALGQGVPAGLAATMKAASVSGEWEGPASFLSGFGLNGAAN